MLDELLGERLDVDAHQHLAEHELENLIVGQRIGAGVDEPLAQPFAMAVVMRARRRRCFGRWRAILFGIRW